MFLRKLTISSNNHPKLNMILGERGKKGYEVAEAHGSGDHGALQQVEGDRRCESDTRMTTLSFFTIYDGALEL